MSHTPPTEMTPRERELEIETLSAVLDDLERIRRPLLERRAELNAPDEEARLAGQITRWVTSGRVTLDPDQWVLLDRLHDEYALWAAQVNESRINEQRFSALLEAAGFRRVVQRGNNVGHFGIRPRAGGADFF